MPAVTQALFTSLYRPATKQHKFIFFRQVIRLRNIKSWRCPELSSMGRAKLCFQPGQQLLHPR